MNVLNVSGRLRNLRSVVLLVLDNDGFLIEQGEHERLKVREVEILVAVHER